jgi:hypothetical protein
MNPAHALWMWLFAWLAPLLVTAPEIRVRGQQTVPKSPLWLPLRSGEKMIGSDKVKSALHGSRRRGRRRRSSSPGVCSGSCRGIMWMTSARRWNGRGYRWITLTNCR